MLAHPVTSDRVKEPQREMVIVSTGYDGARGPSLPLGIVVAPRDALLNRDVLEQSLESMLAAVEELESTPVKLVVVTQGPLPAWAGELQEQASALTWLTVGTGASRAQALNLGLATVLPNCRLVLLCSGDVVVQPDALRSMMDFLRRHPDVDGCVGGLVDAGGSRLRIRTRLDSFGSFLAPRLDRSHKSTLPGTSWCMFRAEVFHRIGGFDESLAPGDDELDWARRAREARLVFWYLPDAAVTCLTPVAPVRKAMAAGRVQRPAGQRIPGFQPDLLALFGAKARSVGAENRETDVAAGEGVPAAPAAPHGGQLDDRTVAFITCVSEPEQYLRCRRYIEALDIPPGFRVEVHFLLGARGLPSAYNRVIRQSKAKYKVYLHQDVFLLHRRLLYDVLEIFSDPGVGMIGVEGATRLPEKGVWFWNNGLYCHGQVLEYRRSWNLRFLGKWNRRRVRLRTFRPVRSRVLPVAAVDGLIMITQYDIPWREDLYDGFIYYEGPHCLEFIRRGLAVVIPRQERNRIWCLHYGTPDGKERTAEQDAAYQAEFKRVAAIFCREYASDLQVPVVELLRRYRQQPRVAGPDGPGYDGVVHGRNPGTGEKRLA